MGMLSHYDPVAQALREHLAVCGDLLALARKEADALRQPGPFPSAQIQADRKALLIRLQSSSRSVASQRKRWCQLNPPGVEMPPELAELLRSTLDTITRVLIADRENETSLLRRGLLPPRSLPRAEQLQRNFVARTYQRHARN